MVSESPKKISLALQGGGSHGAYSWGVLERLLEEERLEIEGISGTSAGAMNAAIMVNGYATGGREGAKAKLAQFWRRVSEVGAFGPLSTPSWAHALTGWNLGWSPMYYWLDVMSRLFSPYELNPMNINPLKDILEETLEANVLHECESIKLFVAATHIESGQARVFSCHEITTDVLLASACLPFMFQAVDVEGDYYWDGGYMGNPAIWPLNYHCETEDVVLVQINPIFRPGVPRRSLEIIDRLNEITFNSSLIAEMRAIDFVSRLIHGHHVEHGRYKDVKMHLIYSPEELKDLNASSKMNTSWAFFKHLHAIGYQAADSWISENFDNIGKQSTVDIREKFLTGPGKQAEVSELIRKKAERKQHQQQAKAEQA